MTSAPRPPAPPGRPINAVFPGGRMQSPKVRAFVDFLVNRLNFDADYMQVLCPHRKRLEEEGIAKVSVTEELAKVALAASTVTTAPVASGS